MISFLSTKAFEFEVVDDLSRAENIIRSIWHSPSKRVALDCEGENLGRDGSLTVVSLLSLEAPNTKTSKRKRKAYLLDVLQNPSILVPLRGLLETGEVTKVTFDCRTDADALWHLHKICLENVLDLQVYKQAIDRVQGKYTTRGRFRYVQGMNRVCNEMLEKPARVLLENIRKDKTAPHSNDGSIWGKRPLEHSVWAYAAQDVLAIELLLDAFERVEIPESTLRQVRTHSERYCTAFREMPEQPTTKNMFNLVLIDVPITRNFRRKSNSIRPLQLHTTPPPPPTLQPLTGQHRILLGLLSLFAMCYAWVIVRYELVFK